MSSYPILPQEEALRYLRARELDGELPPIEDLQRTIGDGPDIKLKILPELRKRLGKLRASYPAQLRPKDPQGGRYEGEACVVVHEGLSAVDRHVMADHDFWTWLAVVWLPDIVEWRFGTDGRPAMRANYGIGQRSENMFFRLWLRAELGKTATKDPYEFARFGDQDLWRSHLLRQGYANARVITQSLLKLQSGRLRNRGKVVGRIAGGDDPQGVRLLAKRLRRLRANVLFECLTPQQAEGLVCELSFDLKKGK
jgi:hypothetical protein